MIGAVRVAARRERSDQYPRIDDRRLAGVTNAIGILIEKHAAGQAGALYRRTGSDAETLRAAIPENGALEELAACHRLPGRRKQ